MNVDKLERTAKDITLYAQLGQQMWASFASVLDRFPQDPGPIEARGYYLQLIDVIGDEVRAYEQAVLTNVLDREAGS